MALPSFLIGDRICSSAKRESGKLFTQQRKAFLENLMLYRLDCLASYSVHGDNGAHFNIRGKKHGETDR